MPVWGAAKKDSPVIVMGGKVSCCVGLLIFPRYSPVIEYEGKKLSSITGRTHDDVSIC
jgi:hypothetical protein